MLLTIKWYIIFESCILLEVVGESEKVLNAVKKPPRLTILAFTIVKLPCTVSPP